MVIIIAALASACSKETENRISSLLDFREDEILSDGSGRVIPVYNDVARTTLDLESLYKNEKGRICSKDTACKIYTGVDVSVHQGDIDWNAVKADGIDFVMLRVGARGYGPEGALYDDKKFAENYESAKQAGLKIGVYFFSQAINVQEAEEEAEFLLSLTAEKSFDYPVAFDWEHISYDTARTDGLDNETITQCALAFCNKIKQAGHTAIIYFNRSLGYFSYNLSEIKDYHFWLAEYNDVPSFIYDFKIWQYTEKGTVAGIDGEVDMNISITDYSVPDKETITDEKEFD